MIGGGGENISDFPFSSIKGELEIDEPLVLPVLLQKHGRSLKMLSIKQCSQDVPFSAKQEDVFPHLNSL